MSDSVLTHPQFLLLQAIARQSCSASELAQTVSVSLPYVLSQLKLLEARKLVKKQQVKEGAVGKPKQYYEIATSLAHITLVSKHRVDKQEISMQPRMQLYLIMLTQIPAKVQQYFSEYFWNNIHDLEDVHSFALLATSSENIELLGITTPEHLDRLRKNSSSFKLKGTKFAIACWMHTVDEIKAGLAEKDNYYLRLQQQIKPLYDPKKHLDS